MKDFVGGKINARYCPISGRHTKFRITFRVYTPCIPPVVVNTFLSDFDVVFGYAALLYVHSIDMLLSRREIMWLAIIY